MYYIHTVCPGVGFIYRLQDKNNLVFNCAWIHDVDGVTHCSDHTHLPHTFTTHTHHILTTNTHHTHLLHTCTTHTYHTHMYHTHVYHTHVYHTHTYHTHLPHTLTTHTHVPHPHTTPTYHTHTHVCTTHTCHTHLPHIHVPHTRTTSCLCCFISSKLSTDFSVASKNLQNIPLWLLSYLSIQYSIVSNTFIIYNIIYNIIQYNSYHDIITGFMVHPKKSKLHHHSKVPMS